MEQRIAGASAGADIQETGRVLTIGERRLEGDFFFLLLRALDSHRSISQVTVLPVFTVFEMFKVNQGNRVRLSVGGI